MIKSIEESKNRLLLKIENLKREIALLIWLEHEEVVTLQSPSNNRYLYLYTLETESLN